MFSNLKELEAKFCLCHIPEVNELSEVSRTDVQIDPSLVQHSQIISRPVPLRPFLKARKIMVKKRQTMIQKRDFTHECGQVLSICHSLRDDNIIVYGSSKAIRRHILSQKRSQYIGVSKSGPTWQAIVIVEKRKTYIGTYSTEIEAANAYDMYSLILYGLRAVTNFSYNKHDIIRIVEKFQLMTSKRMGRLSKHGSPTIVQKSMTAFTIQMHN
jgi:hypothetical protein